MLTRFGVSLEEGLLAEFDRMLSREGYTNRSEAIRDLIRDALVRKQWLEGERITAGAVVLVYNHHQHELVQKLIDVQHRRHASVLSSLHIHLDEHNCLEVILLKGKAREIQEIADALMSTRGVMHGQLVASTTGDHLQ